MDGNIVPGKTTNTGSGIANNEGVLIRRETEQTLPCKSPRGIPSNLAAKAAPSHSIH